MDMTINKKLIRLDIMSYMKMNLLVLLCFVFIFSVNGCGKDDKTTVKDEHTEEKGEEPGDKHEDEPADEVALTDEQIKFMGIETKKLELQNISGYIKVNGEVTINPDQESKVGSIIPGRIRKIYVKEGSFVKAGQPLAIIENPELINVQINYINAKNEYEFSKKEYERQLKLSSDNIGSRKTLNELETNYKKALANYKTLEEQLASFKISRNRYDRLYEDTVANLQRYYTITAPISGNVVERNVTIGQYVEPSSDMFHIVNTSTVFVDLNVFEKDLAYVSAGQKVSLEVSVNPYEVYEGTVTYVNKIFDDEKRTVKVRVAINNKREKLLPNMFVSARIYVKQESVLAVPISAVEADGDNKYIFVKTDEVKEIGEQDEHKEGEHKEGEHKEDEHKEGEHKEDEHKKGIVFKKFRVNTGISDDKFIQVFPIDELKEGEEVVTTGTFYLKSELKKGELGEHDH
jgi:membrane fusion protein, heavy metal efflux system